MAFYDPGFVIATAGLFIRLAAEGTNDSCDIDGVFNSSGKSGVGV